MGRDWHEPTGTHRQGAPGGPSFWAGRHEDINAFERHLDRGGTKIVKSFLHISKAEQRKRFLARLDEPGRQWKFSAADLAEPAYWDDYQRTFESEQARVANAEARAKLAAEPENEPGSR
jgi:polyphosphate kinase 2 (PPK2 family)